MRTQVPAACACRRVASGHHPAASRAAKPRAASPASRRGGRAAAGRSLKLACAVGQVVIQGLGLGGAAGADAAQSLHSLVGEILVAAVTAVSLATGVTLLALIVFGSAEYGDRVFRVLRWIRGKDEPSAPHP